MTACGTSVDYQIISQLFFQEISLNSKSDYVSISVHASI
jgi:hypothetical protein